MLLALRVVCFITKTNYILAQLENISAMNLQIKNMEEFVITYRTKQINDKRRKYSTPLNDMMCDVTVAGLRDYLTRPQTAKHDRHTHTQK